MRHQVNELHKGAHVVIGTPGRLMDVIEKRIVSSVTLTANSCLHMYDKNLRKFAVLP